jgi:hypothetical protein
VGVIVLYSPGLVMPTRSIGASASPYSRIALAMNGSIDTTSSTTRNTFV